MNRWTLCRTKPGNSTILKDSSGLLCCLIKATKGQSCCSMPGDSLLPDTATGNCGSPYELVVKSDQQHLASFAFWHNNAQCLTLFTENVKL